MKKLAISFLTLFSAASAFGADVNYIRCESDTGRTVVTASPSGPWYYLTVVQDGAVYLHDNVATVGRFVWRETYPPQFAGGSLRGRSTGRTYLEIGPPGTTDYVHYEKVNPYGIVESYRTPVVCNLDITY